MTRKYLHEESYRGADALAKLAEPLVTVCGAGALGSHLVDNLARQGFRRLRVVDDDRIEEHNVGTQLYGVADVGARKVDVLRGMLFRSAEIELDAVSKRLDERNVTKLLKGSDVVIDTFDNSASRRVVYEYCHEQPLECLHVGLYADYGEAVWNERYRVPSDVAGDVCEYPLARNLVLLSVALAAELLVRYALTGAKADYSATLTDFTVAELEP